MMENNVTKAPEGICPYCSKRVNAVLLKARWFRRNQYQCTHAHCRKIVYICKSVSCDNYVKSEEKSSKLCDICSLNYGYNSGDYGAGDTCSSSESRELKGDRQKLSNDMSSDNSFSDIGGGDGGGGGGGD